MEGLRYGYYQLLPPPLAEGIRKSPLQSERHKHRHSSEVISFYQRPENRL